MGLGFKVRLEVEAAIFQERERRRAPRDSQQGRRVARKKDAGFMTRL